MSSEATEATSASQILIEGMNKIAIDQAKFTVSQSEVNSNKQKAQMVTESLASDVRRAKEMHDKIGY
jgi:hypothetical protein